MANNIGVLLIGFNRSELLIENYKHIRKFWEGPIVVVVDGYRIEKEQDKLEQEKIKFFFQNAINVDFILADINRGCRYGVTWAISEGFKLFQSLFIIEDDCFISENWFKAVLAYIEEPTRAQKNLLISSDCKFKDEGDLRYYYNDSPLIWGWFATRDVWSLNISEYEDSEIMDISKNMSSNVIFNYANMYRFFASKKIDTWDYFFKLSMLNNGIRTLAFNKRFCNNLGHGYGTHKTTPSKGISFDRKFKINELHIDQTLHFKHQLEDIYTFKSIIQALLIFILITFGYKIEGGKINKLNVNSGEK
jgi:hypothetical protein